jgi:hypothetical protein
MTVTGHTFLSPDHIKTYAVTAGQPVLLSVHVSDGHDQYAVVLSGLDAGGLAISEHHLTYTGDPSWVDYTQDQPPYHASTASRHTWGDSRRFDFLLQVDRETPADTYPLLFTVAGENGGKWAQSETLHLQVLPGEPVRGDGDLDQDGDVDGVDFALWARRWQKRDCSLENQACDQADIDVDGDVDANDLTVMTAHWLERKPLQLRVRASSDDAEESLVDRSVNRTSSDLELVTDSEEQLVGIRFTDVPLDPHAHLARAVLQFTVDETNTGDCQLVIEGQAADQAPAFSEQAGDISERFRTLAAVSWSVPAWSQVGQADAAQQSPELSAIIEEIVARPGWTRGNALVLLISGSGERTAESFDGQPNSAPALHIEFYKKSKNVDPLIPNTP